MTPLSIVDIKWNEKTKERTNTGTTGWNLGNLPVSNLASGDLESTAKLCYSGTNPCLTFLVVFPPPPTGYIRHPAFPLRGSYLSWLSKKKKY